MIFVVIDQHLAETLLQAMSEAVYVVDRRRVIRYWSPAAERLTGFSAAEVVGRRCRDGILCHVDEAGTLLCTRGCPLLRTMRDGNTREVFVYMHHRDGHRIPVAVCAAPLRDDAGVVRGAVEVFHDDSRNRSLTDQLTEAERAGLTDPLTGLANRRMVQRVLDKHQTEFERYGHQFAVIFADVDDFKRVNDVYGHDAGDQVLRLVAATMQHCVRPYDTVGRWGGEEFLVVAPVRDESEASSLAQRLRTLVRSAWTESGTDRISVTMSIGIALARAGDQVTEQVMRADIAMLDAKRAGKDRLEVARGTGAAGEAEK